ncbi:MAG: hypothetical protein E5X90_25695, partial [Mesorhizobium sp.]
MESGSRLTHIGAVRTTRFSLPRHAARRTKKHTGVPKMKKIVLTAAALLAISGSAFAGSDNYGSN